MINVFTKEQNTGKSCPEHVFLETFCAHNKEWLPLDAITDVTNHFVITL